MLFLVSTSESDSSGNLTSEYAFFNKQRIARRDVSSGNVYYLFRDRLGSYRTLTDSTGRVQGESELLCVRGRARDLGHGDGQLPLRKHGVGFGRRSESHPLSASSCLQLSDLTATEHRKPGSSVGARRRERGDGAGQRRIYRGVARPRSLIDRTRARRA